MFMRTFIFAVLAVGVLADGNKRTFHNHVAGLFKLGEEDYPAEECNKLGFGNRFDAFEDTVEAFYICASQLSDFKSPINETDEAKAKVLSAERYSKPCRRLPELKSCVENVLTNMTSCDVPGARTRGPIAKKLAQDVIDYTCANDGEKVSSFVTSNGYECYRSVAPDIVKCVTKSDDPRARLDNFVSDDTLSKEEKCTKFLDISACVVENMKKCSLKMPSKILAGLFVTLGKSTSCNN